MEPTAVKKAMTSNSYKTFAIVGAKGNLGTYITNALLQKNVHLVALTRKGQPPKEYPKGVTAVPVDFNSVDEVSTALKSHKVDVLISAIAGDSILTQSKLIDAGKAAGVDLFVPSEFGMVTEGKSEGFFGLKNGVTDHAKSVGLPTAVFYVGIFAEWAGFPYGIDVDGKAKVLKNLDINVPLSLTSLDDISGFLAHVLTTLEPSKLHDRRFRIQGDRLTTSEIASLFKADIVKVDKVPGDQSEYRTGVQSFFDRGYVSTGWDEELKKDIVEKSGRDNSLWPGHKWQTLSSLLPFSFSFSFH